MVYAYLGMVRVGPKATVLRIIYLLIVKADHPTKYEIKLTRAARQ
jgi:hypothetical protein